MQSGRCQHIIRLTSFSWELARYSIRQGLYLSVLILVAISPLAAAQEHAEAKPLRFDFSPLIGYRTSMSFTGQPESGGTNPHIVINSGPSYGFAVGMRIDDENLVEFHWARQDTKIHAENTGFVPFSQRIVVDQFHGDFTHEYILDEWPRWARPFITGTVGATYVSGGANTFTRFSFGLGTGIKFQANRHLGFRIEAAWLPILVNPELRTLVCGGGCVIHLAGQLVSQGEFSMGPVLRF